MPTFKPDKESQIYKENELKGVVLDAINPHVVTAEIIGVNVVDMLKKERATEVTFNIPEIVESYKTQKKKEKKSNKTRLARNSNPIVLGEYEPNSDKF
jgi:hypothetical protein